MFDDESLDTDSFDITSIEFEVGSVEAEIAGALLFFLVLARRRRRR
jgi:hypothetical protein